MGRLQGQLLVGVINSIGVRADAQATGGLVDKLKDTDADVASAAAIALGRLGGEQAAQALEKSLTDARAGFRSAVAEGCILCAEKFAAQGKSAQAVKLFDQVRRANVPKQRQLEAIRGAILARQSAGVALLIEQLRSADKAHFNIGLQTARELAEKDGLRRYGFHGTSHEFVGRCAAKHMGRAFGELNLISCHLGNGGPIRTYPSTKDQTGQIFTGAIPLRKTRLSSLDITSP